MSLIGHTILARRIELKGESMGKLQAKQAMRKG